MNQLVDFLSGKLTYRRKHASLRNELLARALGLKQNTHPSIIDATAGLAQDSFIIASLGFKITLLEQSAVVYTFIKEAMDRALLNPETAPIIHRMHLIHINALDFFKKHQADIIYLDPMFPKRNKKAAVKKAMRSLQEIAHASTSEEELLQAAVACAHERVVVKRPRLAKSIAGPKPAFSLVGRACRFDVYLIR